MPVESGTDAIRSFTQLIGTLEEGQLHHELSEQIQQIVATLNNHRADHGGDPKAKLSLDLAFQLKDRTVEVTVSTKTVLPVPPRERTILWTTDNNDLSRQNPRQMRLPLTDVGGGRLDSAIV